MPLLNREELIEQAYFFQAFRERIEEGFPAQAILNDIREELLATTRLPMAIDFLRGELTHQGSISLGMRKLAHYFTPFQTFVMSKSEEDSTRFDQLIALLLLEREAEYRSQSPTPAGLFVFQFESLARNRLGYDQGMQAIADDPFYPESWKAWIKKTRFALGTVDFANLVYLSSAAATIDRDRRKGMTDGPRHSSSSPPIDPTEQHEPDAGLASEAVPLFGSQEGRIAKANRGKDPLYLFAALQRQLNYPKVPRPKRASERQLPPEAEARLQRLEQRMQIIEADASGKLDLTPFFKKPLPEDEV
jgi:hypothetical protein